jgi:hypothetical protein
MTYTDVLSKLCICDLLIPRAQAVQRAKDKALTSCGQPIYSYLSPYIHSPYYYLVFFFCLLYARNQVVPRCEDRPLFIVTCFPACAAPVLASSVRI